VALPHDPLLVGLRLNLQGASLAPGGLVRTSNGIQIVIGE